MLKIEPKSLKNTIVFKNNDADVDSIYEDVSEQLMLGNKYHAMKIATEFLINKLSIPKDLSESTEKALEEIQNRRLDR